MPLSLRLSEEELEALLPASGRPDDAPPADLTQLPLICTGAVLHALRVRYAAGGAHLLAATAPMYL